MKKIIALILVIATLCLCCASLASCGGGQIAEFVVPENGYDGSKVTITFYHTMGADLRKVLEDAIVDFNEIYPNIEIIHEQTGSYDDVRDTIKTEISVGAQPNIAYCYPDHVALYNLAKAVVKLDGLIASTIPVTGADGSSSVLGLTQEQIDDFIPGYYEEGKQFDAEGTMYTIPLSKSTELLYYNKTFFEICQKIYTSDIELDMNGNPVYVYETDDKGEIKRDDKGNPIPVLDANGNPQTKPNPNKGNENYNIYLPTTWNEMEEICKKLTIIDPDCIPLGYDSEANWFITMTEQLGSDYTSATGENFIFDNEENYAFVEMFRTWYEKGYVTTQELNGGKYTSELFHATTGTNSYMSIGSSAGATKQRPTKDASGDYPFETGIATIPQVDPSNPQVISQGPSLCIFNKSNPQEVVASWLFVKFLATDVKFQAKFSMVSGYVPVIQSVTEDPTYADFLAKADGKEYVAALAAKACLDQADAYYTSPAFNGSSTARDQVGILIQNCFTQKPQSGEDVKAMIKRLFQAAISECEYHHPQM